MYFNQKGNTDMKFKEYLPLYMQTYQTVNSREHEMYIRNYLLDDLGEMELCDIKPVHIMLCLAKCDKHMRSSGSVKKVCSDAKKIMRTAYANDLIDKDISAGIVFKPVTRPNDRKKPKCFTESELHFLFLEDSFVSDMFRFQYLCGLRAEELLALKWENITKKNDRIYITISAAICNDGGRRYYKEDTKTHHFRTIPLSAEAVELLSGLPRYSGNPFVFANNFKQRSGDHLTHSFHFHNWQKFWYRRDTEYFQKYGIHLPYLSPHHLRHSFAVHSLEHGMSLADLSLYLGHCDTATTTRYYVAGRYDFLQAPSLITK